MHSARAVFIAAPLLLCLLLRARLGWARTLGELPPAILSIQYPRWCHITHQQCSQGPEWQLSKLPSWPLPEGETPTF